MNFKANSDVDLTNLCDSDFSLSFLSVAVKETSSRFFSWAHSLKLKTCNRAKPDGESTFESLKVMYMRTKWLSILHYVFYDARLQAELEEAKEEARIKAQEEIVVRIQEAKVTLAYSFLM